jgi:hypothetical protein
MVRLLPLCAFVMISGPAPAWAEAAYEGFSAPDFTRGERDAVGRAGIGLYTHLRRFNGYQHGSDHAPDPTEIRHERWIPALLADYRFLEQLAVELQMHSAVIRSSLVDGGVRKEETVTRPGDVYLLSIWHPRLDKAAAGHDHGFFDLHNLGFTFGPKIDIGYHDPDVGRVPGAEFRRSSNGSHELVFGLI